MERLKKLLARLWEDKNPAAVHLGAIMDEFEPDVKSLSGVVREYEADSASRAKFIEEGYKNRVRALEDDLAGYKARMAGLADAREENLKATVELGEALKAKEAELAALRFKAADDEARLNSKYVSKMQELYDVVSRKEMDMFTRWEEKNKELEGKIGALESDNEGKIRELKLKEKALEAEVNTRKEELLKTFDRVRLEFEARERDLAAREEKFAALEKKRRTVTEDI
jgi:hypothetical protein